MKSILRLEELAMTLIAIFFLCQHSLGISWWIWAILFFAPDIGMLGYLINTRVGAYGYNLFHHKGVALAVIAFGYIWKEEVAIAIGILLFAHSSFDRIWGYGLKYPDDFKNTHLGKL